MSEIDRCAYYYICMNKDFNSLSGCINIDYDELLECPQKVIKEMALELGLSYGSKTKEIINTICRSPSVRYENILNQVRLDLREEIDRFQGLSFGIS